MEEMCRLADERSAKKRKRVASFFNDEAQDEEEEEEEEEGAPAMKRGRSPLQRKEEEPQLFVRL